MRKTRQQGRSLLLLSFVLALCATSTAAFAAEEDVANKDPARWYQGDDTAKLHHKNLIKEAHAAGAQALRECKPLKGGEAKSCRKEARENMKSDLDRAQRILKASSGKTTGE